MTKLTYECSICYGVNHVSKLQCSICGTIPAMYSVTKRTGRQLDNLQGDMIYSWVDVVNAIGCDRTERYRSMRVRLHTVAADYYALPD